MECAERGKIGSAAGSCVPRSKPLIQQSSPVTGSNSLIEYYASEKLCSLQDMGCLQRWPPDIEFYNAKQTYKYFPCVSTTISSGLLEWVGPSFFGSKANFTYYCCFVVSTRMKTPITLRLSFPKNYMILGKISVLTTL
jgi:hypothetical protein